MGQQFCVNCDTQAGYPHKADCPRPKFWGDPDPGAPTLEDGKCPVCDELPLAPKSGLER